MNRIRVDSNALNAQASELDRLQGELERLSDTLGSISSSLAWKIPGSTAIRGTLAAKRLQLTVQRNKAGALAAGLRNISALYTKTEARIVNGETGVGAIGAAVAAAAGGEKWWERVNWFGWNDLWKHVGSFGIVGNLISTIGGAITEKDPWKKVLGISGGVAKVTEKVANGFSKSDFDWTGFAQGTGKTLKESFASQIDKYNFGAAEKVSDKIAVGAKWAGAIVTVATKAYDNIVVNKEGNSTGRAIAETVGESAVTIGLGIAVGAVVGTIGAPAVVTGAITVGVLWAIDRGFEAVTGKNAAEFISDTVLDGAQKVVDFASNAGKTIGNAVSSAGKKLGGWWRKGVANVFG